MTTASPAAARPPAAQLTNMALALRTVVECHLAGDSSPRLSVFYGPSGYGKSVAAAFSAIRQRAVYIEAKSVWGQRSVLEAIGAELGIARMERTAPRLLDQIVKALSFRETFGEGYVRRDDPQAPSGSMPTTSAAEPALDPAQPGKARSEAQPGNVRQLRQPAAASFAAGEPRPLYVYRKLINAQDVIDWAREQGFPSTLPADDLHVTVVYSKRPVNWFDMASEGLAAGTLVVEGGPRLVERLGDGDATALLFQASELRWRHQDMVGRGASWDWPTYIPHVTISYAAAGLDLAKVKPFQGALVFGPEIFEPIEEEWQAGIQEEATASFAEGTGDQMDAVTERLMAETAARVEKAMVTPLLDRIRAATSDAEVKALLADALDIVDDAPLAEIMERAGFAVRLAAASSTGEGEALA